MASVEKQTVFKMPMKEIGEIVIFLDGDWHAAITRMWGKRKEVDRYLFKIKGNAPTEYCWFECNNQMAQELLNLINQHGKNRDELHVLLNPIRIMEDQSQGKFIHMWQRFKKFMMRR